MKACSVQFITEVLPSLGRVTTTLLCSSDDGTTRDLLRIASGGSPVHLAAFAVCSANPTVAVVIPECSKDPIAAFPIPVGLHIDVESLCVTSSSSSGRFTVSSLLDSSSRPKGSDPFEPRDPCVDVASDMREVGCLACGAHLTIRGAINRVHSMPSASWAELSDMWCCGHEGSSCAVLEGLPVPGEITARRGTMWVGPDFVIVHSDDAVQSAVEVGALRPAVAHKEERSSEQQCHLGSCCHAHGHNHGQGAAKAKRATTKFVGEVRCKGCGCVLGDASAFVSSGGAVDAHVPKATDLRFSMRRLTTAVMPAKNVFAGDGVAAAFAAEMLRASKKTLCRKFVLVSGRSGFHAQVVLQNPYLLVCTNAVVHGDREDALLAASKVIFRSSASVGWRPEDALKWEILDESVERIDCFTEGECLDIVSVLTAGIIPDCLVDPRDAETDLSRSFVKPSHMAFVFHGKFTCLV